MSASERRRPRDGRAGRPGALGRSPQGREASATVRRRVLNAVRVSLALVVASSFLQGGPIAAQTLPAIAGIQGRTASSGLHAIYAPQGLIPITPLLDVGSPDALATIASGPSTFARAATFDPGDILANPDAVLALASSDYPAGTIPPYPYRVSASSDIGEPRAESNPAPGLSASVEVGPNSSDARASMPAADAPAVATFGSVLSEAHTTTDGSTVTVTARSQVTGFDMLGLVTIESIVSEAAATSDGIDTVLTGGTTITGAKVLGTPVLIDAAGVHVDEAASGPGGSSLFGEGGLLGALGDDGSLVPTLADLGIGITVLGPAVLDGGRSGQISVGGLRIDLEISEQTLPVLAQVLAALPPLDAPIPGAPGPEDVVALARARHLATIEVGRAFAALEARPSVLPPPLPPRTPTPPIVTPGVPANPAANPGILAGASPLPAAPRPAGGSTTGVPVSSEQPAQTALGPGVGALALLLLLQPFAGRGLAVLGGRLLTPGAADFCPLERR